MTHHQRHGEPEVAEGAIAAVSGLQRAWPLLLGVTSLFWLLLRTIPKPERLRYPCQQACAANVAVLLGPVGLALAYKLVRAREVALRPAILRVSLVVLLLGAATWVALAWAMPALRGGAATATASALASVSGPVGVVAGVDARTGRAIYQTSPSALAYLPAPNRVVSVHDARATNWNRSTTQYWSFVDQSVVNNMVARGVMTLTDSTTVAEAWAKIIPYQAGEAVAIKINMNNAWSGCADTNAHNQIAETLNAVVDGLLLIGVPANKIWITDPSRTLINTLRARVTNTEVLFYTSSGSTCSDARVILVPYIASTSSDTSLATCPAGERIRPSQVYVDAAHIINLPILRTHGGNYVTLALKNHYGSVTFEHFTIGTMHPYFEQGGNTQGCDLQNTHILADINNNPLIRNKTRLVIGDGLYANQTSNTGAPMRFATFGNDDPNILFFGGDPVATSSVMTDYLCWERNLTVTHNQLIAGARLGLGVFERWDNPQNKDFGAIDYIPLELGSDTVTLTAPNGAEAWAPSSSQTITWSSTGGFANVRLEYSTNSGLSWSSIVASTANTGSRTWTVPSTPSSSCLVRISDAANTFVEDRSNAHFTIIGTTYPLTVTHAGNGSGIVISSPLGISCAPDCSESYGSGQLVTLTAAAAGGSSFASWGGACSGAVATCQVSMTEARSVTATFTQPVVSSALVPLPPCRVLDTRSAAGPALEPGVRRLFTVAGTCGVPANAVAISANLTVVGAGALGDLRVTGGHLATTNTSALSIPLARARANNAIIQLATGGTGTIAVSNDSSASVHFILDVNGYFR
jgi:hypothetical protein